MTVNCHLRALCAQVPETVVTNDDLSALVDTNDQWIVERTGIRRRHKLAAIENASDLGLAAAARALEEAGLTASQLTHVLVATCSPDYISPSVACIISGALNAGPVMAMDFSAACTGFIYGLSLGQAFLAKDPESRILLVCAEALTRRVNWQDRSTCVLFGDAATACVLDGQGGEGTARVEDALCQSDGVQRDLIVVGGGTACRYSVGDEVDEKFFISMRGRDTYKYAVRQMVQACETLLERNKLSMNDISLFVPHQANLRIIEAVGSRLGVGADKVFVNLAEYGNTSSASIPLALSEARSCGRIRQGDRVLVTAFGAGLTWGAALLRF